MSLLKARNRYMMRMSKIQEAHDIIMRRMSPKREKNLDSVININRW